MFPDFLTGYSDRSVNRFCNLIEALDAAPADRPFVTAWVDEDERETVTFAEFRRRAHLQARALRDHGVTPGDRVIVVMPQGIPAMTAFAGAMMLGAVPAFLAYPNFKVEPAKYRSGLAGVTANLNARVVVIDDEFPEEMLSYVSLHDQTVLLRARAGSGAGREMELPKLQHLQLASSVPRHGFDCLFYAAHGLPPFRGGAIAARLGDASGNHAADYRRI